MHHEHYAQARSQQAPVPVHREAVRGRPASSNARQGSTLPLRCLPAHATCHPSCSGIGAMPTAGPCHGGGRVPSAARSRRIAIAFDKHHHVRRGFLLRGLSNTCPQVGVTHRPALRAGQMSDKPKRLPSSGLLRGLSAMCPLRTCAADQRPPTDAPLRIFKSKMSTPESGR